ncbi:MAG: cell division protein FtsL [candidate division NC10 bacterium]
MASKVRVGSAQQELPFGVRLRRGKWKLSPDLRRMLLASGVLLLGLIFYVWQHIQVVRFGYQVERLRAERVTLVQEGKTLNVELGRLRSLMRVEDLARRELGMVNPVPGQVILLKDPREGG